jgi:dolichol-phosphate mannosyltransferase
LSAGYKIGEMPVEHRARFAGVSKVAGGKRALRATVDLFGMLWFSRRQFKGRLLGEKS